MIIYYDVFVSCCIVSSLKRCHRVLATAELKCPVLLLPRSAVLSTRVVHVVHFVMMVILLLLS
jgi:hypothetical protein